MSILYLKFYDVVHNSHNQPGLASYNLLQQCIVRPRFAKFWKYYIILSCNNKITLHDGLFNVTIACIFQCADSIFKSL